MSKKKSKSIYWVDIPTLEAITNPGECDFKNIADFTTLKAARKFVKEHFGGDGKGNVQLITKGQG